MTHLSPPVGLSPAVSHLGALVLTLSYVGSLYLTKPERKRRGPSAASSDSAPALDDVISQDVGIESMASMEEPLHRDHPVVIKSRVRAVTVATIGGIIGVGLTVGRFERTLEGWKSAVSTTLPPLTLLILSQLNASASLLGFSASRQIIPYILAPLLFIGPLYTTYLDRSLPFQHFGRQSLGLGSAQRYDGMMDCLRVLWTRKREGVDEGEKMMLRNLEQRRWIELRNCVAVS